MSTPIWPILTANANYGFRGIVWDVVKRPIFKTVLQTTVTGREASSASWSRARYEIVLKWSVLRDDALLLANQNGIYPLNEYKTLTGFFTARRGSFEPFFFPFRWDKRVTGQVLAASTPAIAADPSNPDSRNYQLVRTLGGTTEPVGGLNTGAGGEPAPIIYVNAVPVTFTANDPKDGWIRLTTAPTAGSTLTGDFSYYHRVRFKQDEAEFRSFGREFWDLKQVDLRTTWW